MRAAIDMLKCCFNPKVFLALGAVAVGIFLFAPSLTLPALPILVALLCPISMLAMVFVMGRGMGMGGGQAAMAGQYSCPMHAEVTASAPGACPKCGMPLVGPPAAATTPGLSREAQIALLQVQLSGVQQQQESLAKQLEELTSRPSEGVPATQVAASQAVTSSRSGR